MSQREGKRKYDWSHNHNHIHCYQFISISCAVWTGSIILICTDWNREQTSLCWAYRTFIRQVQYPVELNYGFCCEIRYYSVCYLGFTLIEWPEHFGKWAPKKYIRITLDVEEGTRFVTVNVVGPSVRILKRLNKATINRKVFCQKYEISPMLMPKWESRGCCQ